MTFTCDQCGFTEPEDRAVSWARTEVAGHEVRTYGGHSADRLFCSAVCIAQWFLSERILWLPPRPRGDPERVTSPRSAPRP